MFFLPYKAAFFSKLNSLIDAVVLSGRVGNALDAASAGFKNRELFHQFRYFGVDLDRGLLEKAHRKYPDDVALLADVTQLELVENFFDIAVSTHTIEHIRNAEGRMFFVNQLIKSLRPDGVLILGLNHMDTISYGPIVELLKDRFNKVDSWKFNNCLTRFVETFFLLKIRNKFDGTIIGRVIKILLSPLVFFLFLIEKKCANRTFLFQKTDLFRCSGKKCDPASLATDHFVFNARERERNFWLMDGME